MSAKYMLTSLVNFFVGIAVLILGIRVFFRLVNASAAASFVDWIYRTSDSLMAPFRGIFPPATLEGGVSLDVSAIFAAIMYLVFGAVLIGLLSLIPAPAAVERPVLRTRRTKR